MGSVNALKGCFDRADKHLQGKGTLLENCCSKQRISNSLIMGAIEDF